MSLEAPGACAPFQAQEDTALAIYDQRRIFRYVDACAALDGYRVGVVTNTEDAGAGEPVFDDAWDQDIAGNCACWDRRIEVTDTPWHSRRNALSHELVHAIEFCAEGPKGQTHYRWFERGIPDAIEAARPEP
jgi:hypothetical protein